MNEPLTSWNVSNVTNIYNYHNNIYKIIIQYYFINNKKNITCDISNISNFDEYLKLSKYVYNLINNTTNIKETDYYCNSFFFNNLFLKNDLCYGIKLGELNNELNNPFLNPISNNKKLYYFSKIQQIYFSLLKFAYICKKKILNPTNNCDLLGNDINKHNSFNYIENNKLYLFSYSDILNLFINNIGYCDNYFFSYPKYICNPYTQLRFSITDLYNMYFFIKKKYNLYSKINIIDTFFHYNFNLTKFSKNNESLITKQNIKRFIVNEPNAIIYPFIKELIKYSNSNLLSKTKYRIEIDKRFPKKLLCDVFKPYLYNFLNNKYNCDNVFRYFCNSKLKKQIVRFVKNSQYFGRRICKVNYKKTNNSVFITKHIDFYKNDIIDIDIDYSNIKRYDIPLFADDYSPDEEETISIYSDSDESDNENGTIILNVPPIFPNNNIDQNTLNIDINQDIDNDSATVIQQV